MEKLLTTEERIRRAEEIYARRKSQNMRARTATVNVNDKKNFKLFKKLIIQVLICSIIYYLVFWIQNSSNVYSPHIDKIKEILSYDINFQNIYNSLKEQITNLENKEQIQDETQSEIQNQIQEENQNLQEATLSATDTAYSDEENVELTQMEQDAKEIKENYNLVKPLEGQVSSWFGERESTSPIVSTNHSGIDIAALEGTKIKAAMEGTVSIATSSSSYRKLYKN